MTFSSLLIVKTTYKEVSLLFLKHLAFCGLKALLSKLSWCQSSVTCLGFILSAGERRLSDERHAVIRDIPPPETQKGMLSFLGLMNYCRQWIPDCDLHDKVLRGQCSKDHPDKLSWTLEMMCSFRHLKIALYSAPTLDLPQYMLLFHLYVSECSSTAVGVLAQEHVAYLSKTFDLVVQVCLRAVTAATLMVTDAEKIVLSHPFILHTSQCSGTAHDSTEVLR